MAVKLPKRVIEQLDALIDKLSKGTPEVRQETMTRLISFEEAGTIPLESLLEMADSEDANLAVYAITALGRSKSTRAVNKLVKLLEKNREGNVVLVEMIVDALGATGQKAAAKPLLGLIGVRVGAKGKLLGWLGRNKDNGEGDSAQARTQEYLMLPVVRALENLMEPGAANALGAFLDHADPLVRWHSIQALLKCRVTDFNDKLREISKADGHDLVREAASIALVELAPLPQSLNN